MSKKLKVSAEEREAKIEKLYAKVGKICVLIEHLNHAMSDCCVDLLKVKNLPQDYASAILVGQNPEPMRRTWETLMKLFYSEDSDAVSMTEHLSNRIDKIVKRRNDTIHRLWWIGWGNDNAESYETAKGIKTTRDKKSISGIKYTMMDTGELQEIITEMEKLISLLRRLDGCIISGLTGTVLRPVKNFHYDSTGNLIDAPPPPVTTI